MLVAVTVSPIIVPAMAKRSPFDQSVHFPCLYSVLRLATTRRPPAMNDRSGHRPDSPDTVPSNCTFVLVGGGGDGAGPGGDGGGGVGAGPGAGAGGVGTGAAAGTASCVTEKFCPAIFTESHTLCARVCANRQPHSSAGIAGLPGGHDNPPDVARRGPLTTAQRRDVDGELATCRAD